MAFTKFSLRKRRVIVKMGCRNVPRPENCLEALRTLFLALLGSLAACQSTAPRPPATEGLVWVPGQTFVMGSDAPWAFPEEGPTRLVSVDGFWIETHEVTNREFARFVDATGYVTTSEQPTPLEWVLGQLPPGSPAPPPESLRPGSAVFLHPSEGVAGGWSYVYGASWRHPEGPGSSLAGRWDHPVVQVSWFDAQAYARWAMRALPTEAEWELAARGGLSEARFPWGDEPPSSFSQPMLNMWQGPFPAHDSGADGALGTAPVGQYPANGYGLYDMAGNVWEWCADPMEATAQGSEAESRAPRALRGGSFLCSDDFCTRYRPSARIGNTPGSATNHTGFRCVRREP